MAPQTRRRLLVAALAVCLTVPIESILLKALTTTSDQTAALQWVATQTPDQLASAAGAIQAYPFAYRRAMMAALNPAARSFAWRAFLFSYLQGHPDLNPAGVAAIKQAIVLASPEAFSTPTPDMQAQAAAIGAALTAAVGLDEAQYVLYRLGPPDSASTIASALPWSEQLANFLRRTLTVSAAGVQSCDCNLDFGNCGCASGSGCSLFDSFPACGWLWLQDCDGRCSDSGGH